MIRKLATGTFLLALGVLVAGSLVTNHSYVTTPSMYPTIPPGSEIFVEPEQAYHVGQVIEFRANGLVWAHRLVKINPDGSYVTKGDNPRNSPDVFDPALTKADVIGAVTHAPRWLGFPELIVHHPAYGLAWLRAELGVSGRLLLIALTLLVVVAYPAPKAGAPRAAARHRTGAQPQPPTARVRPDNAPRRHRRTATATVTVTANNERTKRSTDVALAMTSATDDTINMDPIGWLLDDVLG